MAENELDFSNSSPIISENGTHSVRAIGCLSGVDDRYVELKGEDKIDYTVTMVGRDENAGYQTIAFENDIDEMLTADVVPKSEYDILKSLITHKEEEAYNKGYNDALKDVEEMIKNISEREK